MRFHARKTLVCFLLLVASSQALAAAGTDEAFNAARWRPQDGGKVHFETSKAFPDGLMTVTSESEHGFVALRGGSFSDGTIEFDMKALGQDMPGVRFHQRDGKTADMLYVRVSAQCPRSQDCLQYVPITHGRILWDVYPQYQAAAPFSEGAWNHFRLVISGKRLAVFVNGHREPSLSVGHLEGDARTGTIAFEGPAEYAHLKVIPGLVDGLDPIAAKDPAATDARYLTHWSMGPTTTLAVDAKPGDATLSAGPWKPVPIEYDGLVNFSRQYGPTPHGALRQVAWARTTITADHAQTRRVDVGWLRQIWVFVNGKCVFAGQNLYNLPSMRRPPDGRLSLQNGSFDLPLKQGRNQITVAIDGNTPDMAGRYGWGFKMRLDRADGVTSK